MSRTKMIAIVLVVTLALAGVGALMVFNKSANLLDSEFRVIVTNSMDGEPTDYEISTIPVNSLVAVHKMHSDMLSDMKVGDVIGFYSPLVNGNIYHRVISVDTDNRVFTTKGDNASATETVSFENVNGIVVNVNHPIGECVVYVKQNLLFIVAVIVLLIIMAEAFAYLMKIWRE